MKTGNNFVSRALFTLALAGLVTTFVNCSAFADDIQLGTPAYGGNGCPAGSASVNLSEDSKTLSFLFDEFIVLAGGANRTLARKSCNIAIPIHIPQGLSVSIMSADYRGYVSLPVSASARMTAEYFLSGSNGPKFDKTFIGPTDKDYLFSNKIGVSAQVWSACGADTIIRVNAAMLVKTNRFNEESVATVDSVDYKAGLLYQLQWKHCH